MKNFIREIVVSYSSGDSNKIKITSSQKAFESFLSSWNFNTIELQEEFKVMVLNRNNEVLGICPLSRGGVSGTIVDAKLVFSIALKCNASSIIVAHNHPSGNLKPSDADIKLTKKLKQAAAYLDIQFLDHVIVTKNGYTSFSDKGLM
ncbi:RadC family protein [Allomuricauda sp. ARW1Y1]|jgi:DNA repair protein RadC|uniref:JAB domain-containing protein n=1 Tax=Allomuricauda sp. ARW1Y1 TaxID=2663843 RepID=UPI0015CE95EA|nr:JAB domain-containing protein [Muricauda sp. ARW1Y1]NYJ26628.1 DNA repair protein RadC [Muricauda sp. ARW1Y1]